MRLRFVHRLVALALACAVLGYAAARAWSAPASGVRIAVSARKFEFSPAEIRVRTGERVTLVLTAADFVHGFSVPELNARVDLVPGKVVELTLVPDRSGRLTFLCDNFCGEDHDRMSGVLVVTDR